MNDENIEVCTTMVNITCELPLDFNGSRVCVSFAVDREVLSDRELSASIMKSVARAFDFYFLEHPEAERELVSVPYPVQLFVESIR